MQSANTHIQHCRNTNAAALRRMVHLLATTEQCYLEKQFEKGIQFLSEYINGDEEMVSRITSSRVYWGWWRNEWNAREAAMLDDSEHLYKLSVELRRRAWLALHNPKVLANDLHPHSAVLQASYDEMIQAIINDKPLVEI